METIERGITRIFCILYKWLNITLFRKKHIILFGRPTLRQRKKISFGKYCKINPKVFINGGGGVEIGDYVTLSYGVTILSTSLETENWSDFGNHRHTFGRVKIGNNVWICANVTIVQDVEIADNCVIAAGSVVTNSLVEEGCIYAGVPAKKVKKLDNHERI